MTEQGCITVVIVLIKADCNFGAKVQYNSPEYKSQQFRKEGRAGYRKRYRTIIMSLVWPSSPTKDWCQFHCARLVEPECLLWNIFFSLSDIRRCAVLSCRGKIGNPPPINRDLSLHVSQ